MIHKTIIKLISLGAMILFVCSLSASADTTEEKQGEIQITSVDAETGKQTTEKLPLDHDASNGERGDLEKGDLPENEELIIAPNPDEQNLIAPAPGTDGDVFILDSESAAQEKQSEKDNTPLIGFPLFAACVFIGLLGIVYIYGKRQG